MPIKWEGWAKPDDPIYKMGLVISAQNIEPPSNATAPEPEVQPEGKPSPDPQAQAKPVSPRPRSTRKRTSTGPRESASAAGKRTPATYRQLTYDKPDPTAKPTGRVFWTEADDSFYNEPATLSFKYNRTGSLEQPPQPEPRRSRTSETRAGPTTKEQAIEIATRERRRVRDDWKPRSQSTFQPFLRVPDDAELPEECLTAIGATDERPAGAYLTWNEQPAWYISFRSQQSVEMEKTGMQICGTVPSDVIAVSKLTGEILGFTRGPIGD